MSYIICLKVTKFQQCLFITLGEADEKLEGGSPLRKIDRVKRTQNDLISAHLIEMEKIRSDWLKYVNNLIIEHVSDYEHYHTQARNDQYSIT